MKTFAKLGHYRPSYAIRPKPTTDPFTVTITGQPRGGTTMAAAVVHALGVYVGPESDLKDFHFEDQTMHNPDLSQVYPCIKSRNETHKYWGWKDPTGLESMRDLAFSLRNPRMIIVCRDFTATLQGEINFDKKYGESQRSLEQLAELYLRRTKAMVEYVSRTNTPTLLVSYERAKEAPHLIVEDICTFLGHDTTVEQRQDAEACIGNGYITFEGQDDVPSS